jgi:hypothetical protein
VSFVERFGLPAPAEPPEHHPEAARPQWFGPSEQELGVAVNLGAILGRSAHGVVALSHAAVFSTGLRLHLVARAREVDRSAANRLMHEQHLWEPGVEPTESFLRVGIELPHGARASNLGGTRPGFEEEPDGPVFFENGGGGSSSSGDAVAIHLGYWLWPLPEPGPILVSCEWPLVGIPLSTAEIDGAELVAAAERVVALWP